MLSRVFKDKEFCIATFRNAPSEEDIVKIFTSDEEEEKLSYYIKRKGFSIRSLIRYNDVCQFISDALDTVNKVVCNKEKEPNCAQLMSCGWLCEEIIDFMSVYDIDWSDLDRDNGELYICLAIFARNTDRCILTKIKRSDDIV